VAAIHRVGVIHNDLHHSNVSVCRLDHPKRHRICITGFPGRRPVTYEFETDIHVQIFDFDWSSRVPFDEFSMKDEKSTSCINHGYCTRNDVFLTDELGLLGHLFGNPQFEALTSAFVPMQLLHVTGMKWYRPCWPQQPDDDNIPLNSSPCYRCVPTKDMILSAGNVLSNPNGPFSQFVAQTAAPAHFDTHLDVGGDLRWGRLSALPQCQIEKLERAIFGSSDTGDRRQPHRRSRSR
jgi:serine/threonine protein kinase